MKTRCSCCNSNNLKRQTKEDMDKYDKDVVVENIYECLDCGMTDTFDTEDWIR